MAVITTFTAIHNIRIILHCHINMIDIITEISCNRIINVAVDISVLMASAARLQRVQQALAGVVKPKLHYTDLLWICCRLLVLQPITACHVITWIITS